jgi:hypothetical protein
MFRRDQAMKQKRVRVAVPYGHGTSVSPRSPPLSSAQNQAYTMELAGIPRSTGGGAMGCAYTGFDQGVVCQNTGGMPAYVQSRDSYVGQWVANVKPGFPMPVVQSPGGYDQLMMGGGSGSPECAAACTCLGDPSCPCRNAAGQTCGYTSVNQTCVEPIPGGQYPSLAACEAANARGNYTK